MQCPKCGFQQPDDLFCASCGVNILRYGRRKRWKNVLISIVISGLILVAGITFLRLRNPTKASESEVRAIQAPLQKTPVRERRSLKKLKQRKKPRQKKKPWQMRKPKLAAKLPNLIEEKKIRKSEKRPPKETTEKTAHDWFNEGVKLSDDSPEEIECYQQALKLDPTLAVAYYNLGIIYHSQENDELAIKQFKNFLRYASDSEKEELPLEDYYSSEELAQEPKTTEKKKEAEEEVEEAEEEVEETEEEVEEGAEEELE